MITYCIGDIKEKRKHFLEQAVDEKNEYLDNDELLAVREENGKTMFAVGEIPFSNMKVVEYITYQRSSITKNSVCFREIKYYGKLFALNLPLRKKMRSLSVIDYRKAQFLSSYTLTVRSIYINLDGVLYSAKNRKQLENIISGLRRYFHLYIAVSDSRFIPLGAVIREYKREGGYDEVNSGGYKMQRVSSKLFPLQENYLKVKKVLKTQ